MTKLPAIIADARCIEFACKLDDDNVVLRIERTKRGKVRITLLEGGFDPEVTLSKAKTKALVNWLAATEGIEPS